MQTDVEDGMAEQWRDTLQAEIDSLAQSEQALAATARAKRQVGNTNAVDELFAVRRCRQARVRCMALQRLMTSSPYAVREALDWADHKVEAQTPFNALP